MSFLLDTNVISEWVKARPNRGVVAWLAAQLVDQDRVFANHKKQGAVFRIGSRQDVPPDGRVDY